MSRFTVAAHFQAVDRMTAPIKRMETRTERFNRFVGRMGKAIATVGAVGFAALAAGALAAVSALRSIGDALVEVTDRADNLAKLSRRLDIPIEDLQTWGFAAEQSGVSAEVFSKSLDGFSKRLGEAKAGTGSLFTLLTKLDPEFLKQVQSTTNTSAALDLYIDRMRKATDPAQRAALAAAAFGRAGAEMSNIAVDSAESIAKLRSEALQNGVITMAQAESAEKFGDTINSLKKSFGGLLAEVLLPLTPKITELAEATRNWMNENRPLIAAKFEGLKTFFTGLKDHLPTVMKIAKFMGGLAAALGVVLTVAAALWGILMAVLFLPLTLILAAWAFFPDWFDGLWSDVKSIAQGVADFLSPLWEGIKAVALVVWDAITAGASKAWDLIKAAWEPLKAFFATTWDSIKAGAMVLWDALVAVWDAVKGPLQTVFYFLVGLATLAWDGIKAIFRPVVDWFSETWGSVSDLVEGVWQVILTKASKFIGRVLEVVGPIIVRLGEMWTSVKDRFTEAFKPIAKFAGETVDKIKEAFKPLTDFFGKLWDGIVQAFKDTLGPIVDKISGFVDKVTKIGKGTVDSATGGDAPPPPPPQPQVVHPQTAAANRIERSLEESHEHVTLEIKGEKERVQLKRSKGKRGSGIWMPRTGNP